MGYNQIDDDDTCFSVVGSVYSLLICMVYLFFFFFFFCDFVLGGEGRGKSCSSKARDT